VGFLLFTGAHQRDWHAPFGSHKPSGHDVDLDEKLLTVRSTKFGRTRLVPLHASTVDELSDYLRRRKSFFKSAISPYVFVNGVGKKLDQAQLHRTFYALSRETGLRESSQSRGPRIHDLRHRFAVRILARWYSEGEDPARLLPVLSTYLGHIHVQDTYWYLSAWPELMSRAMARLQRRWEDIK
jgi:integrase